MSSLEKTSTPAGRLKVFLFEMLVDSAPSTPKKRIATYFITTLIVLNVLAVILETVHSLFEPAKTFFLVFEIISLTLFTIEYIARIWICTLDPVFQDPVRGRIRFALTPLAIIDLIAIMPFYLLTYLTFDPRFLRVFRLFRLLRALKLARYSESFDFLTTVIIRKKEELFLSVFIELILLIIASSLMYFVENPVQPETFSSIPSAMWWGVATLTTVGYGDVFPITTAGKFLGSIIAILGIGFFAIPAGILAAGFGEEIQNRKHRTSTCPHCGKSLETHGS